MPLFGALVFLMVVAQTFISVGQTFLSTKRKGKSEADRNVCPTGHRGYAIFAVLLGIFGAAAIVLPAACLPIALGGLLGVLFGLVWQWTGHSASAQAGPQTAAKPSNPGSTSTIAARLGLVLFVASLLLFGCRAATGRRTRRDCGRGGPRCRRRRRAALFRLSRVHTDRRPAEADRRKGLRARGVLSRAVSPRGACRKAAGLADRRSDLSRRVGPRRRHRPVGDRHVAGRVRFAGLGPRRAGANPAGPRRSGIVARRRAGRWPSDPSAVGAGRRGLDASRASSRAGTAWSSRCGRPCATPAMRPASTLAFPEWPRRDWNWRCRPTRRRSRRRRRAAAGRWKRNRRVWWPTSGLPTD